ncbi:ATP-binding protein [Kineococcus sp. R86509]|uniref:ATP-binding protein n=1 Tax=Kineococcus sp. R86509 TaxID=3093851 RepID=UPI0036D433C9
MTLPAELASGRLARVFIDEHWCTTHDSVERERVHLLVTELVVNAVRHGGPPIMVRIECTGPVSVLVSVSDGSADLPRPRQVEPEAVGGRGVHLVDLLSAEWGVERHHIGGRHTTGIDTGTDNDTDDAAGEGKTVWCRLVA